MWQREKVTVGNAVTAFLAVVAAFTPRRKLRDKGSGGAQVLQ